MSSHVWCHGTKCHKSHTQDRVRGSKGSKVLRTRKVKQDQWNKNSFFKYFCSNGCYNDFANANIDRIVALAPRTEALETPIDVVVETRQDWNGHDYKQKEIKERVDTIAE
jgi:hypothetical protein